MLTKTLLRPSSLPLMRTFNHIRLSHSLSNATIADLNKRWESLPTTDQEEIISQLNERQKLNWKELTPEEKKAAWYISYGEWGPRRPVHQKGDGMKIFGGVVLGLSIASGLFVLFRVSAPESPRTMTREWQEASDEYLKSKNANPFTGYSQIQSK